MGRTLVIAGAILIGFGYLGLLFLQKTPTEPGAGKSTPTPSASPSSSKVSGSPLPTGSQVPSPSPLTPPSSVKEIGEDKWKVTLTSTKFFDTGIPIIADQWVVIENKTPGGKWHAQIGKAHIFAADFKNPAKLLFCIEDPPDDSEDNSWNVEAGFQKTLQLAVDDEGKGMDVTVIVIVKDSELAGTENTEQRLPHERWAAEMKQRIARR